MRSIHDPRQSYEWLRAELRLLERECKKEVLLVEHHGRTRWCGSCAEKHLLTAEALAEEAVSLSNGAERYVRVAREVRRLAELAERGADPAEICSRARALRRSL